MEQPVPAMKVSVVDDDPAWCLLVREAFAAAAPEATIDTFTGSEPLLDRLRSGAQRPDVIVLDLNLGGTDGTETLRAIRELPGGNDQKVVVLSASLALRDRELVGELGAMLYLRKPTSFTELCNAVRAIVDAAAHCPTVSTAAATRSGPRSCASS